MASFAQNYLAKQGWSIGKGLGKYENGNTEPIKVYKRFDKTGVGHDVSKDYTNHWWEKGYQTAANNIKIKDSEEGDSPTVKSKTKKKKKTKPLHLGKFMKSTTVLQDGIVHTQNGIEESPKEAPPPPALPQIVPLTDEELFRACGGRTAHKGARHGVTMSAKLHRIKVQDETHTGKITKKNKKLKKSKKSKNKLAQL